MRPNFICDNDALRSSRRHFFKSCVLGGLLAGSASAIQTAHEPTKEIAQAVARRPNIIFIFADDWGYGDLGIHGSTFCKTPHIDRMAAEGILEQFRHLDEQKRVYAAVVAEADAGIGAILSTLKELGLDENTLVVFSSDNGPEWTGKRKDQDDNSTGRGLGTYYSVGQTAGLKGRKRSLFAGGIRVPFVARWPGVIPKGRVDRTSVLTAVDLFPTFLELAGQSPPAGLHLDGQSIVAALKGLGFKRTKPIHWEWRGGHGPPYLWPHLGIRDGRWKMMISQELGRTELYDIDADWAETTNVAGANPDIVKVLTEKMLAWKRTLPTEPPTHCFSRLRAEQRK